MQNVTLQKAREQLFKIDFNLTEGEMSDIFARLKKLLDEMTGELLWPAVKAAHQAKKIRQASFEYALFEPYRIIKKKDPNKVEDEDEDEKKKPRLSPLLIKNEKWDPLADPYTQLDLKAWCSYLCYGGVPKEDANGVSFNTSDHRAFFEYFHVPYAPEDRYWDFTSKLRIMLNTRNIIEHEDHGKATLNFLMNFLDAAGYVLESMSHYSWDEQLVQWRDRLFREFFEIIGEIDYDISAICAYMNAAGKPIPDAKKDDFKELLKEAKMAVDDNKVGFTGNIIALINNDLAEAWEMTGQNWRTGVARLRKAVRGPLPPYAQLTQEQKRRAIDLLEKYSKKLKKPLVNAVKEAHQAAGIAERTFQFNLYITQGTGKWKDGAYTNDAPLLDKDSSMNPDPYQRLDLHGWLKYLRFGGCRRDRNGVPVKDQDAVFAFLGIPCKYTPGDPRALDCEIAEHLAHLNDARNDITGHWTADTVRKTTTREIVQWYEALLALLTAMSKTYWSGQQQCEQLAKDLKPAFKAALGGLSYSVSDILSYIKASKAVQPEVEARLSELGFLVSDGCVTVEEDVEEFLATLPAVIRMIRDYRRLPETAEEAAKLHVWVRKRESVRDKQAVEWIKRGAQTKPAALYYLGCCSLFGRGTQADRHEAIAMIRSAAKKGFVPAQVRMGQYHEGWYKYLWSYPTEWKIQQDNRSLRSDGPESELEWRDKAKEQNQRIVNPAEVFAWYQKAAEQEDPDGLYHLGRCYRDGIGVQYDADQTYQCFWEAARQEHRPAQHALALCYDGETPGIDINRRKAWDLYEALVEKKYAPAMKTLGRRYVTLPGKRDLMKAAELLSQAGHQGDASGYMELAHWFLDGKLIPPNEEEGIKWLKHAAEAKDPEGMRVLGECFQYGIGVKKDFAQAGTWLGQAAEAGDELARWELGNCDADGMGTDENMFVAGRSYEMVKHLDPILKDIFGAVMYTMGFQFEEFPDGTRNNLAAIDLLLPLAGDDPNADMDADCGNGDDQQLFEDMPEDPAFLLYMMGCHFDKQTEVASERLAQCRNNLFNRLEAARMRITKAIIRHELAACYEHQKETAPEAVAWYTKAAEQGLRKSMRALGRCYEQGIGVTADADQAMQWYQKAVDADDTSAMRLLAERHLQKAKAMPNDPESQAEKDKAIDLYLRASSLYDYEARSALRAMGIDPNLYIRREYPNDPSVITLADLM